MIDDLLDMPVYGLPQAEKRAILAQQMRELTAHHRAACAPYDAILAGYAPVPSTGKGDMLIVYSVVPMAATWLSQA